MPSMSLTRLEGAGARHAPEGVVSINKSSHSELTRYDASFFSFLPSVLGCCCVGAVFVRLAGFVISEETLSAVTAAMPVSFAFPICGCVVCLCCVSACVCWFSLFCVSRGPVLVCVSASLFFCLFGFCPSLCHRFWTCLYQVCSFFCFVRRLSR